MSYEKMQSNMDAEYSSSATDNSTTEHLSGLLIQPNKRHATRSLSTHDDGQLKKHSPTLFEKAKEVFNTITSSPRHHDEPHTRRRSKTVSSHSSKHNASRGRSETITSHSNKTSSSHERHPIDQRLNNSVRPRSKTIDSVTFGKKTIPDTDAQAQQLPSIFQFMLGR
ncbi:unnamed protein product [Adineta ricciae]|uniref:Uncharacterized protein n=1 Tax=Adineta ricciae TaxID=249248 RepID=A0A816EFK5_ADIRI|nr:unnamed protein product [Adineta ricciae]